MITYLEATMTYLNRTTMAYLKATIAYSKTTVVYLAQLIRRESCCVRHESTPMNVSKSNATGYVSNKEYTARWMYCSWWGQGIPCIQYLIQDLILKFNQSAMILRDQCCKDNQYRWCPGTLRPNMYWGITLMIEADEHFDRNDIEDEDNRTWYQDENCP